MVRYVATYPRLLALLALVYPVWATAVTTTVCTWKDDKTAAFTLGADDGCASQLDNLIPALRSRGLVATFWINPAAGHFTPRLAEWASAARAGNDFANHTMHHNGAADYASAESEIGGCSQWIWTRNPAQGKLLLFMQGGGTTWNITSQQCIELLNKYKVYPHWDEAGRGNGIHDGFYGEHDGATLKGYLDNAIRDGDWHFTIFHGIGADWIPQSVPALLELLDYMVTKKSTVWFPTCTQAHKYKQERSTAHVSVLAATDALVRVSLTSDMDTALYDYPLTLKTTGLPATWDSCRVTQGTSSAVFPVRAGVALYDAVPGRGEIRLTGVRATGIGSRPAGRTKASVRTAPGPEVGVHGGWRKTSGPEGDAGNVAIGTYTLRGARAY